MASATSIIAVDATTNRYLLGSQGDTFGAWRDATNVGTLIGKPGPLIVPITSTEFPTTSSGGIASTPVFKLRGGVMTNGTAPAINFTFGLHAVAAPAGAADTLTLNATDTAETGSTFTLTTPAANTATSGVTASDFARPADGNYYLAVLLSSTLANNGALLAWATLYVTYT